MSQLPNAPPAIAAALTRLKDELLAAAGKNLAGLVLYGGLARGRYRPGKSDVNVVVLLHEATAKALSAISSSLGAARRAAGVVPLLLTPAEVGPTAIVFPTKLLDIKEHHVVLFGENPFADLDVPREQIRLDIVQELRNLTLRLRRRLVDVQGDRVLQLATLTNLARPLAIEVMALLQLAGKQIPQDDRSAAVFQAGAAAFHLDANALAQLAALRHDDEAAPAPMPLFEDVLVILAKLIAIAEELKEAPS